MAYDFPSSPTTGQVANGYTWDGVAWQVQSAASGAVRFDVAQSLTANQRAQARANIDVLKKNYIINGAMMVSQENGLTAGNMTATGYFGADMFFGIVGGTSGTIGFQQAQSLTAGGSPNRVRATVTVADAAVAAGDQVRIQHNIEGLRTADLKFGSAAAKTIAIQFGVKAPAGTYCVAIYNGAFNRAYVAEYVIAAGEANTDVVKSVIIPGDVTGTWATDNTAGLNVIWCLMAGTSYQTPANAWAAGLFFGSPNQFNFMGTAGNVFELFDVSLTEGTVAPPFVVPDYASELAACQRYYEKTGVVALTVVYQSTAFWKATKRAAPTLVVVGIEAGSGAAYQNINAAAISGMQNVYGIYQTGANSTAANCVVSGNARL